MHQTIVNILAGVFIFSFARWPEITQYFAYMTIVALGVTLAIATYWRRIILFSFMVPCRPILISPKHLNRCVQGFATHHYRQERNIIDQMDMDMADKQLCHINLTANNELDSEARA